MKKITVFTPTYNRAYCLHQVYDSLLKQKSDAFIWLIVDDGSIDNTQQLVEKWQSENKIEIEYIYQKNQGMHGGHNTAYANIKTPFNICIDSDDFMPDDAISIILEEIEDLDPKFAGIVGLDSDKQSLEIIGSKIPSHLSAVKLSELYSVHGVKGDKKLVYRTEIVNSYPPYPIFESEKFVPLGHLYLLIDQDYLLKPLNKVLCIVEYQQDGSTKNIIKQYNRNPQGFAFSRKTQMVYEKTFALRYRSAMHYISSSLFSKNIKFLYQSPKRFLTLLAVVPGFILHLFILIKLKGTK
jgi:glycosyltransferase involved in cell wall biosynthesis